MKTSIETQGIVVTSNLLEWAEAFLIDRKANNLSPTSIRFYRFKLKLFLDYCNGQVVDNVNQVTPGLIRQFLLWLAETGHNPGGIHATYRTLRAWLYWYELEAEPDGWKNPIRKVKAPRVGLEPLDPVPLDDVSRMISVCDTTTFTGIRDIAIMLVLLDTGVRASELLSVNLEDVSQTTGDILIRKGKGNKPRTVFLGIRSRRTLRKYLKHRRDHNPALWVTGNGDRLTYDGLRSVIAHRAKAAGIVLPTLHSFRRAFALSMLRAGTDVFTLSKLMGHESIVILQRYLKQTDQDTQAAHRKNSPADGL